MGDPQHLGLGELGQRLQAMGDPAPQPIVPTTPVEASSHAGGSGSSSVPVAGIDSRLRPYQGAPLPGAPFSSPSSASGTGSGYIAGAGSSSVMAPAAAPPVRPEARSVPTPSIGGNSFSGQPFDGLQPFANNGPSTSSGPAVASGPSPTSPSAPKPAAVSPWERVSTPAISSSEAQGNEPNPLESIAAGQPASSAGRAPGSQPSLPATTAGSSNEPISGLHRALNAVRSTIPLVQRLLPLLEGNFATALGALMAPQHHTPPAPPVDLEPVERGLAEVRNSNRELRTQVQEQGTSLKRVEDQLERVREATDRNTLEQQELVEDLRAVGGRISLFAVVGLVLLLLSLGLNIFFLVELQHILR